MSKDNKKEKTSTIGNINIINYYSAWCLIWYILFKLKIINYTPLYIYLLIFIPATVILIQYISISTDKLYKYYTIIILSIVFHYLPIVDLLKNHSPNILTIEIVLINLILMNLYIALLNYQNLDANKLYIDIYFNNKLF